MLGLNLKQSGLIKSVMSMSNVYAAGIPGYNPLYNRSNWTFPRNWRLLVKNLAWVWCRRVRQIPGPDVQSFLLSATTYWLKIPFTWILVYLCYYNQDWVVYKTLQVPFLSVLMPGSPSSRAYWFAVWWGPLSPDGILWLYPPEGTNAVTSHSATVLILPMKTPYPNVITH